MVEKPVVLLLSQAPGVGGGERVVLNALSRSDRLNVRVAGHHLVCEFASGLGLDAESLELPWISSVLDLPALPAGAFRVRNLCRRVGARVLYGNGTRAFPYCVGARLFGGPRLIAHHHGFFTGGPARLMAAGIDRATTTIIAPSAAVAAPFRATSKVRILPTGIDLERFSPASELKIYRERYSLPTDVPVIGTVSRAAPGKGMGRFIALAEVISSRIPDAAFLVAGGATFPHEIEQYASVMERAISILGKRIVMTGIIGDPENAYRAMDVFVHLSDAEGFPTTAIEAMACGVPVVGFDWGGLSEIVESGATGVLVEPLDQSAATDAVVALVGDPAKRIAMGAAARKRCEERYSLRSFVEALELVILSATTHQ